METQLPLITDCQDCCGACCLEMSTPPGYVAALVRPEVWPDEDDVLRVQNLPPAARTSLILKVCRILDNEFGRHADEVACIWLDENFRCKYYEHRPSICREFPVGGSACRAWRKEFGVDA